jgi:uncharacterized protein YqjF (DUF2071 family)
MLWSNLAFLHWPVDVDAIRPLIPRRLSIDTFDHTAWIGIVPFEMSQIALPGLPPIPGTAAFPELNVRTYVVCDGKPGVWFFSLDAANPLAVAVARRWYHLPYFHARMEAEPGSYRSVRVHRNAPSAEFDAHYEASGDAFTAVPGSLEHFLAERYCLYAANRRGDLFRGNVDHEPWTLRPGQVELRMNTMAKAAGIALPDKAPHVLIADPVGVRAGTLERI